MGERMINEDSYREAAEYWYGKLQQVKRMLRDLEAELVCVE